LSTTEFPFLKFVDDDDDKTERKSFEQILQPLQQSQLSSELLQKINTKVLDALLRRFRQASHENIFS